MCESAHRLRDLLSSLQICKRVVHDILKKLLSICETVVTFLCGHCPNCRTVVSLGRFLLAATLKPPNPYFGAWLPSLSFLYTFSLATCHFQAPGGAVWSSWALLGAPGRWSPPTRFGLVAKVVLFYFTPMSNLKMSAFWGSLRFFGFPRSDLVLGACRQSRPPMGPISTAKRT